VLPLLATSFERLRGVRAFPCEVSGLSFCDDLFLLQEAWVVAVVFASFEVIFAVLAMVELNYLLYCAVSGELMRVNQQQWHWWVIRAEDLWLMSFSGARVWNPELAMAGYYP
jgi:hypothetical protein